MKTIFSDMKNAILNEPCINSALSLARVYGNLLWFADVGVYDASEIEAALISRCNIDLGLPQSNVDLAVRSSVLHVITEPYVSGGHTRLMEKLASMHAEPVDLLITRQASNAALVRVSSFFENVIQINPMTPLETVAEIARVLAGYEKVVLHIHPDDIYCVVACGLIAARQRAKIFFVNHADHVFSFGSSVADFYFELSSYGRRLDGLKTFRGEKSFLGIPIQMPVSLQDMSFAPGRYEELRFITAGSDIKFKPVKGLKLSTLLDRILTEYPNSTVRVVGSNLRTAYWWWLLKLKYRERFSVNSAMPYAEYQIAMTSADFFIDSYPIPGGTAFAEQYVAGRRCVGLISPLQGYSPADLLKRSTVEQVMNSISTYQHSSKIFQLIEHVNAIHNVKARYLACIEGGIVCENLLDSHCEWSGDINLFRHEESALSVDVSTANFLELYSLSPRLAFKLFCQISFDKKIKLFMKIAFAGFQSIKSIRSDAK